MALLLDTYVVRVFALPLTQINSFTVAGLEEMFFQQSLVSVLHKVEMLR